MGLWFKVLAKQYSLIENVVVRYLDRDSNKWKNIISIGDRILRESVNWFTNHLI